MKKNFVLGLLMLIGLVFFTGCSNKLSGTYKVDLGPMYADETIAMEFKDDDVSLKVTDQPSIGGTYEIKDGKLIMQFGKYKLRARLSDDKKSFRIINDNNFFNTDVSSFKFEKK